VGDFNSVVDPTKGRGVFFNTNEGFQSVLGGDGTAGLTYYWEIIHLFHSNGIAMSRLSIEITNTNSLIYNLALTHNSMVLLLNFQLEPYSC
jgi:hypothetical protein